MESDGDEAVEEHSVDDIQGESIHEEASSNENDDTELNEDRETDLQHATFNEVVEYLPDRKFSQC